MRFCVNRPTACTQHFPQLLVLLAAFFALAGRGFAQSPQGTDPMSDLVGCWAGTRLDVSSGDRDKISSRIESILGGAGQQESIEIATGKGTYRGLYTQVFDPHVDKSVIIYVNANSRKFVRLEGKADSKGAEWMRPPPYDGRHRSKRVLERLSADQLRRTQYISEDAGETWVKLWVDELHRDAAKP